MPSRDRIDIALRVGLYAFLCIAATIAFAYLLAMTGVYFAAAAFGTFGGAIVGNVLALRVYERLRLAQVGLYWNPASSRNLLVGLLSGAAAATVLLGGALIARAAVLRPIEGSSFDWSQLAFIAFVLLFGAVGEELLFHGYGFQILLRKLGPFATILPSSVLFAAAHTSNLHSSWLSSINTFAWGVLLGYSFLKSGDLWLPIGLHFGWNMTLPLFGVNLSGFRVPAAGYAMVWNTGPLWSGGEYGIEGGLPTLIAVTALFFLLEKAPLKQQFPPLVAEEETPSAASRE